MNSLESPLEALAVTHLSFGFLTEINHIWTWIAVITAAVSVWRIRSGAGIGPEKVSPPEVSSLPPSKPIKEEPPVDRPASVSASMIAPAAATAIAADTCDGPTRGKFTAYYEDESESELAAAEGEEKVDDGSFGAVVGGGDYWCEGWEKMLRMRLGDEMGWYRYQDLTVLDGNVVRLWDGCCRQKNTTISLLASVM